MRAEEQKKSRGRSFGRQQPKKNRGRGFGKKEKRARAEKSGN